MEAAKGKFKEVLGMGRLVSWSVELCARNYLRVVVEREAKKKYVDHPHIVSSS